MRKRFVAGAALGLGAVLALSACGSGGGGGGGEGDGPVTLKLVAADYGDSATAENSSNNFWKDVTAEFTEKNPDIKIDVQVINWNDIDNEVAKLVQNGQPPDILQTGDYAGFAKEDMLYPVKDVTSPETLQDLDPGFLSQGEVEGTAYGIPYVSSARALFYNKKLFDDAGISEAPKTWDDLKSAAEKLKAKGVSQPFGLPLGQEEAQAESYLWMMGNGGGYKDDGGKWTIDSPQNVEAFNYLKGLVDVGLTTPNPGTKDRKKVWEDFAAGKVGMVNGGPMSIPIFEDGKIKDGFEIVPMPGKDGPLDTTLGVSDWIMAFNQHGHQEQIKKFFDFYFSGSDAQQKMVDTYKLLPVSKSGMEKAKSDEQLKLFIDLLPNAKFYPFTDPKWSDVNEKIKQTIGKAVTGDPKQVLGDIQKTATE